MSTTAHSPQRPGAHRPPGGRQVGMPFPPDKRVQVGQTTQAPLVGHRPGVGHLPQR